MLHVRGTDADNWPQLTSREFQRGENPISYVIDNIRFYVRETEPARFPSALGKAAQGDQKPEHVTSPLCHVRMEMRDDQGNESFGCSADRLSVRWLDKRPGRDKSLKLKELVGLIELAGRQYLETPGFETPFAKWQACHPKIMQAGRAADQEDLTSAFASALLERAMLDGVSRLAGRSFFEMVRDDRLGFRPQQVHPLLEGVATRDWLPPVPNTQIQIRHTIGWYDPLTDDDWPREKRLNDGLPETVQDYIARDGIRMFKVKISGDADADLRRLARIWEIMPHERTPGITLDANEAFDDLETFARFVERLEREQLGLFQHILFIEQPLPRRLALDPKTEPWIRRVAGLKPVIIDESDASVEAFRRARQIGYAGTSHKNCKGVFKSLLNRALLCRFAEDDPHVLMSGEDLQNLPIVPLHQDFVTVGMLGLTHCERNGHHYNFGLSMLSDKDKQSAARHHRDLYQRRGNEWFLRIRDGRVDILSLFTSPGFGVRDEPDWGSMTDLRTWLKHRPAPPGG